jgi:hypothetical protein
MRLISTLLAVALSASIAAGALTDAAAARQPVPQLAYDIAYVKAFRDAASYYNVHDCADNRCTGVYYADAIVNGREAWVRDTYTIRIDSPTVGWALNDDHWTVVAPEVVYRDMYGPMNRKRRF